MQTHTITLLYKCKRTKLHFYINANAHNYTFVEMQTHTITLLYKCKRTQLHFYINANAQSYTFV